MKKTPTERLQEFRTFVEDRQHWTLKGEDSSVIVGQRIFRVGRYAAGLWIEGLRDRWGGIMPEIKANISVPYAAGPEEYAAGDLPKVTTWIDEKERLLTALTRAAEAPTYDDAYQVIATRVRHAADLHTAGYVLDFEPRGMSVLDQRHEIVKRCSPHLARTVGGAR